MNENQIRLIKGQLQTYAWGRPATESIIAASCPVDQNQERYAEYWLGTHPKAPSVVIEQDRSETGLDQLGIKLNFLFKILSVNQALSIQTHPNADFAKTLHKEDPANYPDTFPKPEVGIAISQVKILYDFRPVAEITALISEQSSPHYLSALSALVSGGEMTATALCTRLLAADPDKIAEATKQCLKEIEAKTTPSKNEKLIKTLLLSYPASDPGILVSLLMNIVELAPGEALFIEPGILHAYLDGELFECMAPSDNVIRGGLTPKFVDHQRLSKVLITQEQIELSVATEQSPGYFCYDLSKQQYFSLAYLTGAATYQLIQEVSGHRMFFSIDTDYTIAIADTDSDLHVPAGFAALINAVAGAEIVLKPKIPAAKIWAVQSL